MSYEDRTPLTNNIEEDLKNIAKSRRTPEGDTSSGGEGGGDQGRDVTKTEEAPVTREAIVAALKHPGFWLDVKEYCGIVDSDTGAPGYEDGAATAYEGIRNKLLQHGENEALALLERYRVENLKTA